MTTLRSGISALTAWYTRGAPASCTDHPNLEYVRERVISSPAQAVKEYNHADDARAFEH
jgi:hypothetical protein